MSDSDREINNLITTLIQNFESKKVTGLCIEILRNALNEKEINDKIQILEKVKIKLKSEEDYCTLTGTSGDTKINTGNNTTIKDSLILLIDNTINKIEKVQKAEAEAKAEEAARKEKERLEAENLKELLSKADMSIDDAMNYFDKSTNETNIENIADEFISIEVKQVEGKDEEAEGGKKQAKKPKRKANKTKRVKKSNKKKRKPKRKTMRKIKKIIFR